jgi:dTDP-glucose 4,6-dehydratase
VIGTYNLIHISLKYWRDLPDDKKKSFRLLHISTDEVFGSLGKEGYFTEESAYNPKSPYSASKAGSDHFVKAWYHTYGLPVLITNCSNNYGPYQFPEKLIPVIILNALKGKSIPVYGKGENIRDWIYVEDHVNAILEVVEKGRIGQTYTVGARNEQKNLDLVKKICSLLDQLAPEPKVEKHETLIDFVQDRPGHDFRYAVDPKKIEREIGWQPSHSFEEGLKNTVVWYIKNLDWCEQILNGSYRLERLGLEGISK